MSDPLRSEVIFAKFPIFITLRKLTSLWMSHPDSTTTMGPESAVDMAKPTDLSHNLSYFELLGSAGAMTQTDTPTRVGKEGSSRQSLQAGDQFDHFVLVRPLGEGGFGQVWLATDVRLSREVAIKLPHRRWRRDSLESRRFHREAEVAAKLTHPNLIPILDAELQSEHAYIVSEYCPGPTLSQWMRERSNPVPARMAVSIVAQLADGLKIAHDRGLIHRDVKPSNIILTQSESDSPVPRLTDFGLARVSADVPETHAGTLIGSGPYMSPEQAAGNTDEHGPHSDVHALGVLLYELLTGESPFASVSEIDTIRRIVSQDPPSIRQRRPSLSRDISAVCQRCLEKQPSRRYRDAGELLADLRRVLAGHSPIARPIGQVGRAWRWATRNRGLASMSVAAVVGLIVGVMGLSGLVFQSRRSAALSERLRAEAVMMSQHAFAQQQLAHATREQSLRNSYTSDISLAFLRLHQGHYGEAQNLLDRQIPKDGEIDLRNLEWNLLDSEIQSRYAFWGKHDGRGTELSVLGRHGNSARVSTVVSGALDGVMILWDSVSGREKSRLGGLLGRLDAITASSSGDILISGSKWLVFNTSVVAIDPASGKTTQVFHAHPSTVESIRISLDASVVASGSRHENVRCSSATGEQNFSIENGTRNVAFGMSSDGTRLLVSRRDPNALELWDTNSGTMTDQWQTGPVEQVAMAHRHPFAAYEICNEKGFGLVSTDDLTQRRWIATAFTPNAFEFSLNDRYLAVADSRSGVELFARVLNDQDESELTSSSVPPNYRSIAYMAGQGGRIEDIEFIRAREFVTISLSGSVERFAPTRSIRKVQYVANPKPHSMTAVANPAGLLSLNLAGKLSYFPANSTKNTKANPDAGQLVGEPLSAITSFAVSRDHKTIAISDSEGQVRVLSNWRDAAGNLTKPEVRIFSMTKSHSLDALGMSTFSSTGRFLAVMSDPCELAVFDLWKESGDPAFLRSYENEQTCVTFSPHDRQLFVCGYSGIEMIDLLSNESTFRLPDEDFVRIASFSPLGDRLIVGLQNGSIACLDQDTGESQFVMHSIDVMGNHSNRTISLCFLNESKLMTLGSDGSAHFWNIDQRVQLGSFAISPGENTSNGCECVYVSENGGALTVALDRHNITEVHRWTWRPVGTLARLPAIERIP